MTKDEHERERLAFWDACCAATLAITEADAPADPTDQHIYEAAYCARLADAKLAERDKRWPVPEDDKRLLHITVTKECCNCAHIKATDGHVACIGCTPENPKGWEWSNG